MPGKVYVERRDAVATLVLDHRERRNAISVSMWRELGLACASLRDDPEVRCVVLRGAGEEAFVSGADISEFGEARGSAEAERSYDEISGRGFGAVMNLEVPVIALIHGYCIGGGAALALACDLRYAADDASFAIPAARLGLGYAAAGIKGLIDVVGPADAKEIFFTARRYAADEALAMGLVNRVFPKLELDAAVSEIADRIAGNAPLTLRAVKRAVRDLSLEPQQRRPADVHAAVAACFESEDYREGVRAFLEKRTPRFRGR